jgi:hydroxyacylglutathione hydrolase
LADLQNHLNKLPNDRDIVVVCLSGHRSEEGVTMLRNAGFTRATCMSGGLTAWKAAGYPLEGSNP